MQIYEHRELFGRENGLNSHRASSRLSEILAKADTKGRFRSHRGLFHNGRNMDVHIEYGFTDIKVYVPNLWKRVDSVAIFKEIFALVYLKVDGLDVPTYGPLALAELDRLGMTVPDNMYIESKKLLKEPSVMKKLGYPDMVIAKATNQTVGGYYQFDCEKEYDVKEWAKRSIYICDCFRTVRE